MGILSAAFRLLLYDSAANRAASSNEVVGETGAGDPSSKRRDLEQRQRFMPATAE